MRRVALVVAILIPAVVLAGLGAAGWAWVRCDLGAAMGRAAASWVQPNERWLYACGRLWRSTDGGRSWQRVASRGLPPLAREGVIAVDRTPGRLYLGLVLGGQSRRDCPLCAFTEAQPALFVSDDSGAHWTEAHRFRAGPAGATRFQAVYSDPNYSDAAWAVVTRGDYTVYFATNTGGRTWQLTCEETADMACDPPDEFLSARHPDEREGPREP